MKKNLSKTAFTLIELIVSLGLLCIIVLGIFSINQVLSTNGQDYGQKYLVKSSTQATLNNILNNVSLAVGTAGTDPFGHVETGILIGSNAVTGIGNGDATNNPNTFCIHQDIPSGSALNTVTVNNPATAPPNYPGSRWLCYTYYGSGAVYPYQVYYCAMPYNESLAFRGAGNCCTAVSCASADANISVAPQFVGSAYSVSTFNGVATPPQYSNGIFSIAIQNCLNNSLGTCSNTGTSTDPANNPETQVSGNTATLQESL